jgi:SAM-dependent methyltransferase
MKRNLEKYPEPVHRHLEYLECCPCCESAEVELVSDSHDIWLCRQCLVFYTNPRPSQEFIISNYSEGGHYRAFEPYDRWDRMWAKRVRRVTGRVPSGRLLDVGAGIGTPLHQFQQKGFQVEGTEISAEAVEKARSLYGIELRRGYVEEMDFPDESFDAVTMWHVFEHLPAPGRTLAWLRGKLAPGGYVFIAVPNNSYWRVIHKPAFWFGSRARRRELVIPAVNYSAGFSEIHVIHYTPASLRRLMEIYGFEVVDLSIDHTTLYPSPIKTVKEALRDFVARRFHIYTHNCLFLCARKI